MIDKTNETMIAEGKLRTFFIGCAANPNGHTRGLRFSLGQQSFDVPRSFLILRVEI
jgi:hypothetical protein